MKQPAAIFGSTDFGRIIAGLPMTCLDVGARHGFCEDLLPIADAVDACGFEPDAEECLRLNAAALEGKQPWRSLRYIPAALGPDERKATLNLYRQRGCSSILTADRDLAAQYSRADYYEPDGTVELSLSGLDDLATDHGLTDAAFMKIDIQGYELEVFQAMGNLLERSLVAIRCEVSFVQIYKGQPLFSDIASFLRQFDMEPIGFEELHHWRRSTKLKHPAINPDPRSIPYSRGQLIHGDAVFFRRPEGMADNTEDGVRHLLNAAFLALVYGYVDHAADIFARKGVRDYLGDHGLHNIDDALRTASTWLHKRHCAQQRAHRASQLRDKVGRLLRR